jgi:hypothetical protein
MQHLIQSGPPLITSVKQTDNPGIEAIALCLVDGYSAEVQHTIDLKHQEYNHHTLRVWDSATMTWSTLLDWDYDRVGSVPVYPEPEAAARLSRVSEEMWHIANTIATQSRLRQQELDIEFFIRREMALEREKHAYYQAQLEELKQKGELHGVGVQPVASVNQSVHVHEFDAAAVETEGEGSREDR